MSDERRIGSSRPRLLVAAFVLLTAVVVPAISWSARQPRSGGGAPPTSISFGVAGDMGANSKTDSSLRKLNSSGASFFMAIGDLDYNEVPTPQDWCSYIKSHLPKLGSKFPFEIVAGNHENKKIQEHAACLPDRLGSKTGPNSIYGAEYFFDYPAEKPLVRVLMLSPKLTVKGTSYSYKRGDLHFNWVSATLDDAAAKGIPWTVVGYHMDSPGSDLTNLMVQKHVDVAVYGHKHGYSRGKQVTACPTGGRYDCVSDDGVDKQYPKHRGTIFLRNGSFGQNPSGFSLLTVTTDRIDARFLGEATDTWSIS